MLIIGIAGPTASGKSTFRQALHKYLSKRGLYRIPWTRTSDLIAEFADSLGYPKLSGKQELQDFYDENRHTYGDDFVSKLITEWVESHDINTKCVIVDGIRLLSDISRLKDYCYEYGEDLLFAGIRASYEVRLRRYRVREGALSSPPKIIGEEEFHRLEAAPSEAEIEDVLFEIENSPHGTILDSTHLSPEELVLSFYADRTIYKN